MTFLNQHLPHYVYASLLGSILNSTNSTALVPLHPTPYAPLGAPPMDFFAIVKMRHWHPPAPTLQPNPNPKA